MRLPPKAILFFLALAGLGACRQGPAKPSSAPKGPVPEQTIQRFTLNNFADGTLEWALTAPHADVFELEHRVEMKRPFIQFYKGEEKSSALQADRGRIDTETKDMWAWQNVVMTSTDGARLTSDWMQYVSALDLIQSTAPVTIERGGSVTNGVGWEARPDLSQIVIHQQKVEILAQDMPRKRRSSEKKE